MECVKRFFRRRFRYEAATWPRWKDVLAGPDDDDEDEDEDEVDETEKAEDVEKAGSGDGAEEEAAPRRVISKKRVRLDEEVEASGWKRDMQQQLEQVSR